MNLVQDPFRLHAYVDGELTPDEIADFERELARHPDAIAEVAALRAQRDAMHARYDGLLTATSTERLARRQRRTRWWHPSGGPARTVALAATIVVAVGIGVAAGWMARGQSDRRALSALGTGADRDAEGRLRSFVQTASLSHAIFVPEVRHPVEVAAADEAHLVAWLSKRLSAPLVVPRLGDVGWELLGGRLLPDESGPIAQFMYQDRDARRMTLAVSRSVAGTTVVTTADTKDAPASGGSRPAAAFRIATENGNTVFYWIDADFAYALTGRMSKSEMTAIASRVYRQLDDATRAGPH